MHSDRHKSNLLLTTEELSPPMLRTDAELNEERPSFLASLLTVAEEESSRQEADRVLGATLQVLTQCGLAVPNEQLPETLGKLEPTNSTIPSPPYKSPECTEPE